jgi:hypothetical protein
MTSTVSEKPLFRGMTKGVIAEGDQLRYSPAWITARRGILKVYPDRLECGDWTISFTEIREAVLSSFRSSIGIPGYVLRVDTADRTYHFGLNGGRYWKGELPFPVRREKAKLRYSAFSLVARAILIALVIYYLVNIFYRR